MRDAVATMGTVLPDEIKPGTRDAVHVACIAVTAKVSMHPGTDVGADGDPKSKPVGIVDPFLKEAVPTGSRFWLYLYPRTITGLNHHWSHPDFPEEKKGEFVIYEESYKAMGEDKARSERWLEDFADSSDVPSYDELRLATEHVAMEGGGHSIHFGTDASGRIPPEFWIHAEKAWGITIQGEKPEYFSCAC